MKKQKCPTRILFFQERNCCPFIELNNNKNNERYEIIYPQDECSLFQFVREHDFDLIAFNLFMATDQDKENLRRLREEGTPHSILFFYQDAENLIFFDEMKSAEDDLLKVPAIADELNFKIAKIQKTILTTEINIQLGPFVIEPKARLVHYMNQFKKLGRREFQIFQLLAQKKDEVVSREKILEHLYFQVDLYDRTIDSHISHLRKKLWELAGPALQIISVYGHGYRIQCQES